MNNILPLLAVMMMSKENSNGMSMDMLAPLLTSLGFGESTTALANSAKQLFEGGASLEKLLPLALNMMNTNQKTPFIPQNQPVEQKNSAEEYPSAPNYLKPVSSILDERINFALAHYFAND